MSILDALRKMLPEEKIDGRSPFELVEMVDLDIAFTPVVRHAVGEDFPHVVPRSVEVEKWPDGRYVIVDRKSKDWDVIDPESLKEMRARYLMVRGYYYKIFDSLPHSAKQEVLASFFPEGMIRWPADSPLGKLMTGK